MRRALTSLIAPLTSKDGGTMHASNPYTRMSQRRRVTTALVAALAIAVAPLSLAVAPVGATVRPAAAAGFRAAPSGPTAGLIDPGTVCAGAGTGDVTCTLYAEAGTLSLPDKTGPVSVPVWSFTDTQGGQVTGAGPTMVVTAGDHVTITVHNDLPPVAGALSLSVPQLEGFADDTTGTTPGGDPLHYTFTIPADRPGTYLYEAGPTENGSRQAAMGLVGALVVRPSGGAGTAYGTAASAFDDETVVVLTEIDPGLAAAPLGYDLRQWAPRWRLLDGRVYPAAPRVATAAGHRVLLRYVNGGLTEHALGLLGTRQTEVGLSGRRLAYPADVTSDTVAPGDTLDTVVTVPDAGRLFPVYETAAHLDNAGAVGPGAGSQQVVFGGMLTMLDTGPVSTVDTLGPVASVVVSPPRIGPGTDATFTATVQDTGTGGSNVTAAEWALDSLAGPWHSLTVTPGVSVSVSGTVSTASLSTGSHTVLLRGADQFGNTGDAAATSFVYDASAPTTSGLAVSPSPSNRPTSVTVSGTATDAATGGSLVQSVQARLDDPAAAPVSLDLATPGSTSAFSGQLPLPPALVEGRHTVYVTATDSVGNESIADTVHLDIDLTGPTAVTSTLPAATNGVQGSDGDPLSLEFSAVVTDPVQNGVSSDVTRAEGFLGAAGPAGTGFVLTKYTNAGSTRWISSIPLSELVGKADGTYTVSARGQDAAGNWGPVSTGSFAIDHTKPTVASVVLAPNPTQGATVATLTATATDAGAQPTPIVYAEWYEGTDPGVGQATALQVAPAGTGFTATGPVDVTTLSLGAHQLHVRVLDQAGNWSDLATASLVVNLPNAIFSDGFERASANPVPPWSSRTAGAAVTTSLPLAGLRSLATAVTGATTTRVVVDDTRPAAEASYHASFQLSSRGFRTSTQATPAPVTVFMGLNAAGQAVFQVQYRKNDTSTPQVRLLVTRVGGTTATPWTDIPGPATTHTLRVDWANGTAALSSLTVDALSPASTGLINTSARLVDTVRLGPSAGLVAGAVGSAGTPYFDSFVSTRYSLP